MNFWLVWYVIAIGEAGSVCCGNESGRTCGADPPPDEVCGQNHKRKRNTMK